MTARESERKRARSPDLSEGIEALLDQWVTELEGEAPEGASAPEAPPPERSRRSNRVARERTEPLTSPQEPPARASEPPQEPEVAEPSNAAKPQLEAVRAARAELQVHGSIITFPREDAQIVLTSEGERLVHRGTVGVRGPCAPTLKELAGLGLREAQARALDFVLAWFGAPFDAVSGDPHSSEGPRWGAWQLSGPSLVDALARWKQHDAAAFEARLGRLGIDVRERASGAPLLTVLDMNDGHFASGREALALLASEARLLAALAHAGREHGAQLAQLRSLLEHSLRPVLEPSELFATPRALAVLFHAELRFGRRGTSRLMALAREEGGAPGVGERVAPRFAKDLQSAGRGREAAEVRRILSSPELAAVPA